MTAPRLARSMHTSVRRAAEHGHNEPHRLFSPPYSFAPRGWVLFCVVAGCALPMVAVGYQQKKNGFWWKKQQ